MKRRRCGEITLIENGKEVNKDQLSPDQWRGNPLAVNGVRIEYDPDPNDDECSWETAFFTPDNLINLNSQEGKFVFENKGSRLILTRAKEKALYDYSALAL